MRDTVQNREIRETTIREKKKTRSMKDRKKSDTKHPLCRCLGKGLKSWLPPTKHFFSLSPFFPPFLYLSIIPSFVMEQWRILIRNTSLFLRIGVAKKFHSSEWKRRKNRKREKIAKKKKKEKKEWALWKWSIWWLDVFI